MPVDETILTTCPRDCYDACGIEVALRDGKIRHVRGDRNHPVSRGRLCSKCAVAYNGIMLDPEARLQTPLARDGRKGDGRFRPVSWEDALTQIAPRLSAIADGPGPETILNAHYTGTFALLGYHFPMRFMRRLGAREVDPDTICNKAGHVALDYLYGPRRKALTPARPGTRAASSSGERTHRLRPPISTSTGCPRPPDGFWSSTRCAPRPRAPPISTFSRSRAATRRWHSRSPT